MRSAMLCWVLLAAFVFTGCATMVRGTTEDLSVTSEPSGAKAELSDGQEGITPCQFKCKRSRTLMVKITKDGYYDESVTVTPVIDSGGFLLGGLVDYGTGAVYQLQPNPVYVILKEKPEAEAAIE